MTENPDGSLEDGQRYWLSTRFPPARRTPGRARAFVTDALRSWGVSEPLSGDILLAASELVTNAVEHGRGEVSLELRLHGECIRLRVGDGATEQPVLRRPGPRAPRGRGVALIDAVSTAWGSQPTVGGKWVWAEFRLGG
jgi:anti-sigma regulatory factor (Ser/Thr protein kinase)